MSFTPLGAVLTTAATLGVVHTALGPDHYLPFVMMTRARRWSTRRALVTTLLCGAGHVLGSVLLGLTGLAFGMSLSRLQAVEAWRGDVAAWLLTLFGLVYLLWGLRRCSRKSPSTHSHGDIGRFTPWVLFTIFVFGPCEVLIPLFMYVAVHFDPGALAAMVLLFAAGTIGTMLLTVGLSLYGIQLLPWPRLEKHGHAIAGAGIMACGGAILLFGW